MRRGGNGSGSGPGPGSAFSLFSRGPDDSGTPPQVSVELSVISPSPSPPPPDSDPVSAPASDEETKTSEDRTPTPRAIDSTEKDRSNAHFNYCAFLFCQHNLPPEGMGVGDGADVSSEYDLKINYVKKYRKTMKAMSKQDALRAMPDEHIRRLYEADNDILRKTMEWRGEEVEPASSRSTTKESTSSSSSPSSDRSRSPISPTEELSEVPFGEEGRRLRRFVDMSGARGYFGGNYSPMLQTSLPSVRKYAYQGAKSPRELRIPTQVETKRGHRCVSPLFKRYLQAKSRSDRPGNHVYFNGLKLRATFRTGIRSPERSAESGYTQELIKLERYAANLFVITLPVDVHVLEPEFLTQNKDNNATSIYNEMMGVVYGNDASGIANPTLGRAEDFFMSEKARNGCGLLIPGEWKALLDTTFEFFGLDSKSSGELRPGMQQAIWRHFFHYELPRHVLNKTGASSFNFSCKDGIDRGAAMSLVYNLHRADEAGCALNSGEKARARDAAAWQVKHRPANKHGEMMDGYLKIVQPFRLVRVAEVLVEKVKGEEGDFSELGGAIKEAREAVQSYEGELSSEQKDALTARLNVLDSAQADADKAPALSF